MIVMSFLLGRAHGDPLSCVSTIARRGHALRGWAHLL
jgi:hypothetical protein